MGVHEVTGWDMFRYTTAAVCRELYLKKILHVGFPNYLSQKLDWEYCCHGHLCASDQSFCTEQSVDGSQNIFTDDMLNKYVASICMYILGLYLIYVDKIDLASLI